MRVRMCVSYVDTCGRSLEIQDTVGLQSQYLYSPASHLLGVTGPP